MAQAIRDGLHPEYKYLRHVLVNGRERRVTLESIKAFTDAGTPFTIMPTGGAAFCYLMRGDDVVATALWENHQKKHVRYDARGKKTEWYTPVNFNRRIARIASTGRVLKAYYGTVPARAVTGN